jgi:hypothetical protein
VAGAAQQSGGPVDTQLWNWMRHMGWL